MTDIVSPLLQWMNANPQWAGLVIFAISAGESAPIFGTLVPGSITMTAFGALAGAGVIPLWSSILWAILGAIVGDGIGYWIGYHFKEKLHQVWPFKNNPQMLEKAEVFFTKYGGMSVFIGRFVGPVRAIVPIVAGMFGMKPSHFIVANITSAIGWAPAYMLPGILLGAVALELPPEIALHVILVLIVVCLFILLCLWFIYKICLLIQNKVNQLQDWVWKLFQRKSYLSPITSLLKHHDPNETHGQLNLAFFLVLTVLLLFSLVMYIDMVGSDHLMINRIIYHLFRGIRGISNTVETSMLYVTLLGQKQVILPVLVAIFAWLLYCKCWRAAFHTIALGILATGSIYTIKLFTHSPRPWGIMQAPNSFSLPSGHTVLATVVFMGLAFLVAHSLRPAWRWLIYTSAILISCLVGVSRLYLGAHWFTDVLAAWLLSAALLMLIIISYERKAEDSTRPKGLLMVSSITLVCMMFIFNYHYFNTAKVDYTLITPSFNSIHMQTWWENKNELPTSRTSLFGFPSQEINIQWLGNLEEIKSSLLKAGWSKPPARDLISTIHRIADISSTQYLPLISPQYLDKKPTLILIRQENKKTTLVIRLWDSYQDIQSTASHLWVGIVGVVPRSYSWLFKHRSMDIEISPQILFPQPSQAKKWEWKLLTTENKSSASAQKILLVRKHTKK